MPACNVLQSPVLVGRDAFLTLIEGRLADAAAGSGRLLFVAGEAGIGKTCLLGVIARQAQASGFAVACIRGCPCVSCGSGDLHVSFIDEPPVARNVAAWLGRLD